MGSGFKSLCRNHMWVEFVDGSLLCSERFFSSTPVFPSPQKPTLPNSNSVLNSRTRLNEFIQSLWDYFVPIVWDYFVPIVLIRLSLRAKYETGLNWLVAFALRTYMLQVKFDFSLIFLTYIGWFSISFVWKQRKLRINLLGLNKNWPEIKFDLSHIYIEVEGTPNR